ncbi:MAG: helix-hairpin-helix domain-containing protein [Candidatus Omnitrophota bacterium]|nr:helix-hairpin-helix domain-containing protein [Candidatus Omnitrophota bacterium]
MFNLTKSEKGVIVFLAAGFLLGCGLIYFQKINSKFCLSASTGKRNTNSPVISPAKKNFVLKSEILSKGVNINEAGEEELVQLPGIGHVLAGRIIDYREHSGYFDKLDDIKKIPGIADKKFERIKEYLTLE